MKRAKQLWRVWMDFMGLESTIESNVAGAFLLGVVLYACWVAFKALSFGITYNNRF